jgi:NAD(P)-dependent dehydrogenase (short-subunit alcohol dehydrogenase family)
MKAVAMSEQRVAVVTGASSGIGQAIAATFLATGFRVFGASRGAPAGASSGIEHVTIDVNEDESVRTGVATILGAAGRIDILVNNAGYLCAGAFEEVSIAEAKAQFETNYFGVARMSLAVLPGMRERRAGTSSPSAPSPAWCRCRSGVTTTRASSPSRA